MTLMSGFYAMAKGCIYHTIETCSGGPWVTAVPPFRSTEAMLLTEYNRVCDKTPAHVSVRVVEMKVLQQRNGISIKDH